MYAPLQGTAEQITEALNIRERLLTAVDSWLDLLPVTAPFSALCEAAARLTGHAPAELLWSRYPADAQAEQEYLELMRTVAPAGRAALTQTAEACWWLDHEFCDVWDLCVAATKHRPPEPGHIKLGPDWGLLDLHLPDFRVVDAWQGNMRRRDWIGRFVRLSPDAAGSNLVARRMRGLYGWSWELFAGDHPVSAEPVVVEH